jgi:hypothetical protein
MVSIIDRHFPKSCHSGFDLGHQIELGGGRPTLACGYWRSACSA